MYISPSPPVSKVEVELPVKRHPEGGQAEDHQILGAGRCFLVSHEGDPQQFVTLKMCPYYPDLLVAQQ